MTEKTKEELKKIFQGNVRSFQFGNFKIVCRWHPADRKEPYRYKKIPTEPMFAILNSYDNVYNKRNNSFNFETLPSNRDEEYSENCRFTLEEAFAIVEILNGKIKNDRKN